MFTELFHTTTLSNFNTIRDNKKILSRKISKQEPNSNDMPSGDKLIYFSCNEEHNFKYIVAKNIIPKDIVVGFKEISFDLIQIKVPANNKQITNLEIEIVNDEDSFLKPVINLLTPLNGQYNLNHFIVQTQSDKQIKEILSFLPNKTFSLRTKEYEENRDCLINQFELKTLLSSYYDNNPVETCALKNELDLEKLKFNGVNSMYRKITITSKNITSKNNFTKGETEFSITHIGEFKNII